MKHLFAIAVFLLAACSWAVGDTASDERELTQLVNDLNAAIVKPDIAFLERVLAKDYVHYRPHGNVETRAQYLEDRKSGSVDFDSLVADEIKVRVYGDTAIVTYRSTAKGKDQDGAIDEQRRWTRVSFGRTDTGSSSTPRGQRSRSPERGVIIPVQSRNRRCLHGTESGAS
jgi:ketosteroid isomerase-like protein